MTVRETLIRSVYALKAMSQNDMEKLVDAYAHELAEKIRPLGTTWEDMSDYAAGAASAFLAAADLIDPEVTS